MKVIYHSSLCECELSQGSVFYATPGKACFTIQKERADNDYDIILNGISMDTSINSYEIDSDAELVIKNQSNKYAYCVKMIAKPLSNKFSSHYKQFNNEFIAKKHNEIDSIKSGHLKLYAIDKSTKVEDLTELFKTIKNTYSAFRFICDRPKSHLKAISEVRPIETVKRVGYESIPYLASHSEDWLARTASGLKPARLFSRVEDDEYQIYENRVVKTLLDLIISFLQKKEKEFREQSGQLVEIMNRNVQTGSFGFDVSFQKAVAELTSSKINIDEDLLSALELVDPLHKQAYYLLKKYRTLKASKLYKHLKKSKPVSNPLNHTNILLMDKHYNKVFKLWKPIHKAIAPQQQLQDEEKKVELIESQNNYKQFCKVLCGYVAHILNFCLKKDGLYYRSGDNLEISISEEDDLLQIIIKDIAKRTLDIPSGITVPISAGESFESFYYDGKVLSWDNDIADDSVERFASLFKKKESRGKEQAEERKHYVAIRQAIDARQREYPVPKKRKILICPMTVELESDNCNNFREFVLENAEKISERFNADYVVVALPKCEEPEQKIIEYAKYSENRVLILPLTMFDINSFRRIQNLFLRQIVFLNNQHCPMCGGKVRHFDNQLICDNCNQLTLIETICPSKNCKHKYNYLTYDISKETINKMHSVRQDDFYQFDSIFQYKDIVPMLIDEDKIMPICPNCKP